MTQLICPKCGSDDHTSGYGLAAGPMGSYCFCNGCDVLLEFSPDLDGLSKEDAFKVQEWTALQREHVWGAKL